MLCFVRYCLNKNQSILQLVPAGKSGTYAIPEGVTEIGECAFWDCSNLSVISIPNSVKSIGIGAFYSCSGLTSMIIPDSVTSIGKSAFSNCTNLTNITLSSGLTNIGSAAFEYCAKLKTITIPASVNAIGNDAFEFCNGLTEINVDPNNKNYSSLNGVLLNKDQSIIQLVPAAKSGDYTIPESVTAIGESAFWDCNYLTGVTLPNGLTRIENYAFTNCSGITSITIPTSVTYIGNYAFGACCNLKTMSFQGNAPSFGSYVFSKDTLTICYPAGNTTWTDDIKQNYDGTITWKEYNLIDDDSQVSSLDCEWATINGKQYWYEKGVRQGTYDDANGVMGDGTIRGREIYDPKSNGWYWLDACYDGAKAVSKEVWMPYIYQNEASWSDDEIWSNANASDDGMAQQVHDAIASGTGKWVRYDENGKMYKGWCTITADMAVDENTKNQIGNTYYYDNKTGLMAKGWLTIDGVKYHFDETSGVMLYWEVKKDFWYE